MNVKTNRKLRAAAAILLSCSMILETPVFAESAASLSEPVPAEESEAQAKSTYTEEEIEKRITEAGESYIDFYRKGYSAEEEESDSELGSLFNIGMASTSNKTGSAQRDAVYEEEYMEEAAVEEFASESAAAFAGPSAYDDFDFNMEKYSPVKESGFVSVKTQPFSTFGADVDTASYSSLRRKLLEPYAWSANPHFTGIDDSAVRLEEMINYFGYDYSEPEDGETFGVTKVLTPCPWNEEALLLKVGIKAKDVNEESLGSNIVFLIDTSGSMFDFDKLPLVKKSLEILLEKLDERDRISIVTYAGSEEVVAEGVPGNEKTEIMDAINALEAWGSTWGEGGINRAYEIAEKNFIEGGNNRVILCTDGDFNVGVSSEAGLLDLISEKKETGVFFSCLGFGGGNYNDTTMETLADNGNGNYFYIDSEREAKRALSEEFMSTIYTVAKDTKFQIEFNPETVRGYRLIGYENRKMAAEDFADDKKDGGEVGAGQCVTVLYEIIPVTSAYKIPETGSRYAGKSETKTSIAPDEELLVINIRSKKPDEDESTLREYPLTMEELSLSMDPDTSWAAGVAQAGMIMRDSEYAGTSTLDGIYDRLKYDEDVMKDDFKAEFLFMLRAMKTYKE